MDAVFEYPLESGNTVRDPPGLEFSTTLAVTYETTGGMFSSAADDWVKVKDDVSDKYSWKLAGQVAVGDLLVQELQDTAASTMRSLVVRVTKVTKNGGQNAIGVHTPGANWKLGEPIAGAEDTYPGEVVPSRLDLLGQAFVQVAGGDNYKNPPYTRDPSYRINVNDGSLDLGGDNCGCDGDVNALRIPVAPLDFSVCTTVSALPFPNVVITEAFDLCMAHIAYFDDLTFDRFAGCCNDNDNTAYAQIAPLDNLAINNPARPENDLCMALITLADELVYRNPYRNETDECHVLVFAKDNQQSLFA